MPSMAVCEVRFDWRAPWTARGLAILAQLSRRIGLRRLYRCFGMAFLRRVWVRIGTQPWSHFREEKIQEFFATYELREGAE